MKELLKKLIDNKINITIENNSLRIKYDGDTLPEDLVQEIKENKEYLLDYLRNLNETNTYEAIENVENQESYQLSSAQRRLWILNQIDEGALAYNMPFHTYVNENINIKNLEKSFQTVIDHHEILRTVFKENEQGEIRQWIIDSKDIEVTIEYIDLRNCDQNQITTLVDAYVEKDSFLPFDFENGPLFRSTVLQIKDDLCVLYYNIHHIISDGWSMKLFHEKVLMAYEAISKGTEIPFAKPRVQYKDYAAWQLNLLENNLLNEHKNYWTNTLSGELPTVDFQTDKKRPAVKSSNGKRLSTSISIQDTQKLRNYCLDRKGSLFMGLISVLKILIYRYTEQKDIIVGTPIAGRNHADLEDQLGFYVNTLALRNQVNPESTFEDFFEGVKKTISQAFEHQLYPFDVLIEDLGLKRDVSRSAIFDIMLNLHNIEDNSSPEDVTDESTSDEIVDYGICLSKFDLEFDFLERGNQLRFDINYNTDVYQEEVVIQLMTHFKSLLNNVINNSEVKINQVNYLSDKEIHKQLNIFNDNGIIYPQESVVELFAQQVLKNPEKTALTFENKKISYKQLDEKSGKLASFFIEKGIKNKLIPICFDRSFEMIIAILAVLRSGNAYVPIDVNYPIKRTQYIINDTQAEYVLTSSNYVENFESVQVLDLDKFNYKLQNHVELNTEILPNDLAYCIYTSGTTGNPKGVLNEHVGLTNRLLWMRDDLNLNSESILLQKTPYVFDVSVWELLMPFAIGCELVIAKPEGHVDPEYLQDVIDEKQISIIHFVPSMLNAFLDSFNAEKCKSLQHVVCSGEALSFQLEKKYKQLFTTTRLHNYYGPTEAAIDVTAIDLTQQVSENSSVSIGYPVSNTQIYIVDEYNNLKPIGSAGELLIGGIQVARGYLNNEPLTSEKFIPNPFQDNEKVYKTGDLARWLPDGKLDYIGRKDSQVKIRGFRIELGEIENSLLELEQVSQAVVLVKENNDKKQLVAYIVVNHDSNKTKVKELLQQRLPEYMIPSIFIEMDNIPVTSNGKVDRKALPNPDENDLEQDTYVAPTNQKEKALVEIWQNLLGVEKVGVNDNFFSLGGDSITAIQFVNRAKKENIFLKVKDVFKHQTISKLANNQSVKNEILSEQGILTGEMNLLPIHHNFFNKKYPYFNHYNQSVLLTVPNTINLSILENAIQYIYQKHDALRLNFVKTDDSYVGVFDSELPQLEKERIDTNEEIQNKITIICNKYNSEIDIEHGSISKFVFIQTPSDTENNRLFITIHHLAIDGVSWRILIEDLTSYINNELIDQPLTVEEKTTSYRQWQEKLQEYADSKKIKSQINYWESIIAKASVVPQDNANQNDLETPQKANYSLELPSKLTQKLLKECNHAFKTEINDLLLTALALSLTNWSKTSNIVIGLEGHGRVELFDTIDLSKTVGWFTTLYPVLLENISNDVEATLVQTKENLRAVPDSGIGYGLLRYLNSDENVRANLVTDVEQIIFNYLGQIDNTNQEEGLFKFAAEDKGNEVNSNNHDSTKLTINGAVVNGALTFGWSYDSNKYKEESIKKLAIDFNDNLINLVNILSDKKEVTLSPSDYGLTNLVTYDELKSFHQLPHPYPIEDVYRLSPLQEGMLFHSLLNQKSNAYLSQISFDIIGDFNRDYFEKAWQFIIDKHSVFRTAFFSNEMSSNIQCVYSNIKLPLQIINLQNTKAEALNNEISNALNDESTTPFELNKAPLFRLVVLLLPENKIKLIYTSHHIVTDGWSSALIFGEFITAYKSLLKGNQLPSSNEKDKYKDYIDYIFNKDEFETVSYWENLLSGLKHSSLLPFTNSKELQDSLPSENKIVTLIKNVDFVENLEKYSQSNRLTINTIVQGIWAYLLAQYTNSDTVVYGTVISGRPAELKNIEDSIGLYINTIPLFTTLNHDDDVVSWLSELQNSYTTSREDFGHSSLTDIQKQTKITGDLFDSLLVFENYPIEAVSAQDSDLVIENVRIKQQNNFPLTISTRHFAKQELVIEFEFDSKKISNDKVEMITRHFYTMLDSIIESDTISDLEYLTFDENNNQIIKFNDTTVSYQKESESTVLDLFYKQVEKSPNSTAVTHKDKKITYKELDSLSNQLSNCLSEEYDIKSGDVIGIKFDRSEWTLISILGILKLGATFVPIDPTYNSEREAHILSDSQIKLLITETNYLFDFSDFDGILFSIDIDFELNKYSETRPETVVDGKTTAYIIYTSGSTGLPKGVVIAHASLFNYLSWGKSTYLDSNNLANNDFGLYTSLSFDLTITSLFLPIISGGTLHVYNQENTVAILKSYLESQISCIKLTPAHISLLNEIDLENSPVQIAIVGGDALQQQHINTLKKLNPSIKIYNEYGPTEATVGCMIYDASNADQILIGKPIANTEIYILNNYNKLLPIGISGEIYIGGKGLAKGYLNQVNLTNQKFIDHPFITNKKLYKTGDIGKWLPDGNMVYLGREDNQVKIRGYRVEIGEIEKHLLDEENIKDAVVVVNTTEQGEKELIAYLVLENKDQTILEIRNYLAGKIPAYMMPNYMVSIKSMPLTVNGKIDKDSLPSLKDSGIVSGTENVAPTNPIEEKIASIWKEHLSIKEVGIKDDYFHLGGDSIKMIRFINSINKLFNTDIPIATFYENPTIEGLALFVQNAEEITNEHKQQLVEVDVLLDELEKNVLQNHPDAHLIANVYPISDIQLGMILTGQLMREKGEYGIYHDQFLFQLASVDINRLEKAMELMMLKHETLRTSYNLYDYEEQVQIIYKRVPVTIGFEDISYYSKEDKETFIENFMNNERIHNPFNINEAPVWRVTVFKIGEADSIFAFQFHHAMIDGWGEKNFRVELFEIYSALEKNPDYRPSTIVSSIRDSVVSDLIELKNEENISFWKNEIKDYKRLDIFTNEVIDSSSGNVYDEEFTLRILEKCKQDKITPKALFLSGYLYVLSMLSPERDITLGLVSHRRPVVEDGDKLLGCFLNSVPYRFDMAASNQFSWKEYVSQVNTKLKNLQGKDRFSLNEIANLSGETFSENPFFDALFNFVDFHVLNALYDDEEFQSQQNSRKIEDFDFQDFERTNTFLNFTFSIDPKNISISCSQIRKLKSNHNLNELLSYFDDFINNYCYNDFEIINNQSIISKEEFQKITEKFNESPFLAPTDTTLSNLFQKQAKETPDEIALVYLNEEMSYKEVDLLSNQFANYLMAKHKIEKGDFVGVKLERNHWTFVVILGILKAGAVYVPIDPNYPASRIDYIEADSQCKISVNPFIVDDFISNASEYSEAAIHVGLTQYDLAYIIYTSGSTGNPKGVMMEHKAILNTIMSQIDAFNMKSVRNTLQFASLSFDASIWETFKTLLSGSCLYIVDDVTRQDPLLLGNYVWENNIDIATLPPAYLKLMDFNLLKSIKTLITAGEPAVSGDVKKFLELNSGEYINAYGPTEVGICGSTYPINKGDSFPVNVPIGKPISNTKIYILDDNHQLKPIGVSGEICIATSGLAKGYLNKPELTAEKFVNNPFAEGELLYKTGDLGRWSSDGNLEFQGRKDTQVKVRGHRIELEEIERQTLLYSDIYEAVVLVEENENNEKQLELYYVSDKPILSKEIRSYLSEHLPAYMLPDIAIRVDVLPLTTNGKIDKKALALMKLDEPSLNYNYVAPTDDLEMKLVELWEEVLNRNKIGIYDSFFEIGGNSLKAVRLISRIRREFNISIDVAALYNNDTITAVKLQINNSEWINNKMEEAEDVEKFSF